MDQASQNMSEFNIALKLSRPKPEGGWETWSDIVDRTRRHYLTKIFKAGAKWHERTERAFELVEEKKVLPSQRALQFSGAPLWKNEMRAYNCAGSYCDRPRFFSECFFLLLSGVGTGFSVHPEHVSQLPDVKKPTGSRSRVVIGDSIEGWAQALDELMMSYFVEGSKIIDFDFSEIREKGSWINIGATHAGPEPLKLALDKIRGVLDRVADSSGRLSSVDCSDVYCHFSDAVLAGGSRRSAGIVCFAPDDEGMRDFKVGNWFAENPQRARVNISAVCPPTSVERSDFDQIFDACREWGDPAFLFLPSSDFLVNPCGEITFLPLLIRDPEGNIVEHYSREMLREKERFKTKGFTYASGWQLCNLTEINGASIESREDALQRAEASAIFGTIQAGMIETGYLGETTHEILRREMNLGCSITGIQENRDMIFDKELLGEMIDRIREVNVELTKALGWRPASRLTSIKPSGNSSVNLGCSAGVTPVHSERYLRRVQVNPSSSAYQLLKSVLPSACEPSVWSQTGDEVVSFPILSREGARTKRETPALELLEDIKFLQENWARRGTVIDRVEGLHHGVSNTVTVKPEEWEPVREWIWKNRGGLSGVTMLASFGDLSFDQAPYERIYSEEEARAELSEELQEKARKSRQFWIELRESMRTVDFSSAQGTITGATFEGCDSESCSLDFRQNKED